MRPWLTACCSGVRNTGHSSGSHLLKLAHEFHPSCLLLPICRRLQLLGSFEMNFYRPRRPGPELELEDAFLSDRSGVLDDSKQWWLAGSLPLGAGRPDIVAVHYEDSLDSVGELRRESVEVLAYLRAVGRARLDTVAERLQYTEDVTEAAVAFLHDVGALRPGGGALALTPVWRELLPEVVAIEFKVSNWRRALSQATRNLLFAHQSFVALPSRVAARVCGAPEFIFQGVGIISVPDEGQATIARRARCGPPRSWRYYYELASRVVTSGG